MEGESLEPDVAIDQISISNAVQAVQFSDVLHEDVHGVFASPHLKDAALSGIEPAAAAPQVAVTGRPTGGELILRIAAKASH